MSDESEVLTGSRPDPWQEPHPERRMALEDQRRLRQEERRRAQEARQLSADFELNLYQAEKLLSSLDRARVRLGVYRALTASVAALALATGAVAASLLPRDDLMTLVAPICGAVTAVVVGACVRAWLIRPTVELAKRDAVVLNEAIDVLRELLPFASQELQWSPARSQLMSARVGRMPVTVRIG